jgi:hypothetical protein
MSRSDGPRIRRKRDNRRSLLVGVRVDEGDGHTRVSRGDDFVALGGTREAHEHLRETVAGISDEVKRRGRDLAEVHREELRDILSRVIDKTGPAPS